MLISCGFESGSKRAIEAEWSLGDYEELAAYWRETGPPLHISMILVARALGVEIEQDEPEPIYGSVDPDAGPSIEELAARIQPPVRGGSTLEASLEVIRLMRPAGRA